MLTNNAMAGRLSRERTHYDSLATHCKWASTLSTRAPLGAENKLTDATFPSGALAAGDPPAC